MRTGWGCQWCPKSCVPPPWQGEGGQQVTSPCFHRLRRALGQGWCLNSPQTCIPSSPAMGVPGLCPAVAQESPKAVAAPLVPPAMHPHPAAPQDLGEGVSLPGGPQPPQPPPPGVGQTHSKGDPRAKDADRARLFSLAAFCCCIHGNTITRDIYIIYILLKLHNQCTKTRVHC